MSKRENNKKNFLKVLKSIIREIDTDYDQENFSKAVEEYTSGIVSELVIKPDKVDFDTYDDNDRKGYAFFKVNKSKFGDVCKKLKSLEFSCSYYIIITVDNMGLKREVEKNNIEIIKILKKGKGRAEIGKINSSEIYVNFLNENSNRKYPLNITKRVDSICNDGANFAEGYIFTAKLHDIVELYYSIGDSLFDYNVRYRIKNELNVDGEILKTLKEKPEMFWFYNNGVTIIINDKDFSLNNPRNIILSKTDKKYISVINGAQTISTAADFFSDANDEYEAKCKAYVVLRIINLREEIEDEINDISIALNRQKSINDEDISFTFSFVEAINKIVLDIENDQRAFEISKRGASLFMYKNYPLKKFAKIVKCYLGQKPGVARNQTKKLIKSTYDSEIEKYTFSDTDIYKEIKTVEDFYRYYSPVNFADSLLELFEYYSKQNKPNLDNKSKIYKYSSYYFVAKTIYSLNGCSSDFSNFNYSLDDISESDKEKMVTTFVNEFTKKCEKESIDSNDFKKEVLYNKKIKDENKMPDYEALLKRLFCKKQ